MFCLSPCLPEPITSLGRLNRGARTRPFVPAGSEAQHLGDGGCVGIDAGVEF